jgi:hypothetical protein
MNSILVVLAVVGTWFIWALIEAIVGEFLRPLLDPVYRFFGRLINRSTMLLLWALAIGSMLILSPALESDSTTLRWLGVFSFMTCLPVAVGATISYRNRRRRSEYGFPCGRRTG